MNEQQGLEYIRLKSIVEKPIARRPTKCIFAQTPTGFNSADWLSKRQALSPEEHRRLLLGEWSAENLPTNE